MYYLVEMVVVYLLCSVVLQLSSNIVLQNRSTKIAKQIVVKGITIKTYRGYYGNPILFLPKFPTDFNEKTYILTFRY